MGKRKNANDKMKAWINGLNVTNECSFCGSTKQIVWEDVDGKKACVDCKESDEE